MIVRIAGTLIEITDECAVIERDGLAREVLVPRFAIGELAACRGREVTLHTLELLEGSIKTGHLTPRILGFLSAEDREFFIRFVEVKGIGPRKALRALTEPVGRIASWIEEGNTRSLATLSGVGRRGAELIVATLRGKLEGFTSRVKDDGPSVGRMTQEQRDAMELLIAWGDSRAEAQRWLERAAQLQPELATADQWVKAAYRVKTGFEG